MAPGGPRFYLYTSLLPHKSKIVYLKSKIMEGICDEKHEEKLRIRREHEEAKCDSKTAKQYDERWRKRRAEIKEAR